MQGVGGAITAVVILMYQNVLDLIPQPCHQTKYWYYTPAEKDLLDINFDFFIVCPRKIKYTFMYKKQIIDKQSQQTPTNQELHL